MTFGRILMYLNATLCTLNVVCRKLKIYLSSFSCSHGYETISHMNEVEAESHDIANIIMPSSSSPQRIFLLQLFLSTVSSSVTVLFHQIHQPPFWPSQFPLSWQLHHIFNLLQNVKEQQLVWEAIKNMDIKTANKMSHRNKRAKEALKKKGRKAPSKAAATKRAPAKAAAASKKAPSKRAAPSKASSKAAAPKKRKCNK